MTNKTHWENVYDTKLPNEVSWTQEKPETSLQLIANCKLPKTAKIIDIGGGDSNLVDYLLEQGFENITVLDISEKAIEKAKQSGANAILFSNYYLKPFHKLKQPTNLPNRSGSGWTKKMWANTNGR